MTPALVPQSICPADHSASDLATIQQANATMALTPMHVRKAQRDRDRAEAEARLLYKLRSSWLDPVGDNRRRLNDNAARRPPAPKDSDRPLRSSWISRSQSTTSETTRLSGSDDGDSNDGSDTDARKEGSARSRSRSRKSRSKTTASRSSWLDPVGDNRRRLNENAARRPPAPNSQGLR